MSCPSWTAASVIATVELATTTERDDARVTRAFERARQRVDADASLEALPNQSKARHTRLSVRAPSSAEAIAQATEITEAMQAAFSREGEGTLSADIRRRTTPVADSSTGFLGDALRIGAAVAGLLGLALIALGFLAGQRGTDGLPKQFWWATAGGLAIAFVPLLLPVEVVIGLMIMAIPILIAGIILWKTTQLRHAASWPSTRARIVKSQTRAVHRRSSGEVTQVVTVPDIEYEFRLGDRVLRGTQIGVGEIADTEAVLNHYPVGATVPVYYNPKDPADALLERDPPLPVLWLYLIAAAVLIAGFAVLAVFANGTAILEALEAHFPPHAFVPGMGFFTLGGDLAFSVAVVGAAAGGGSIAMAGYRRACRREHRRALPYPGWRRAQRQARDLVRTGHRVFLSRRRPRVSQHPDQLRRKAGGQRGIGASPGSPIPAGGRCRRALRSEEPVQRRPGRKGGLRQAPRGRRARILCAGAILFGHVSLSVRRI